MYVRALTAVAAIVSCHAAAQPQVPGGFSIQQIAPLLDAQVPQLEAIDDPSYGIGVITAAANPSTDLVTVRLIQPSGTISPLGIAGFPANESPGFRVLRLRLAPPEFDELLHLTVKVGPDGTLSNGSTALLTITSNGIVEQRDMTAIDASGYDFDFGTVDTGTPEAAIIALDSDNGSGTRLGYWSADYQFTETSLNSVPTGRTDTDVRGLRRDVTGLYGGGLILADSDDNDNFTAIYSLTDIENGGTYNLLTQPVGLGQRLYGDLDIAEAGSFGGVIYITEQVNDEIQQVAPNGTHTTWATDFVGLDSLSIGPDGESMYVADLNGVWLIRPEGNDPGPAIVATDPSVPPGTPMTGDPVDALRVIFTEPVSFSDTDVTITNAAGQPVAFDASGSGSQFMIIGLAAPLSGDDYTVTLADTITSVATAQPLDGDNDGIAGGDATLTFIHRCLADDNQDGQVNPADFNAWILNFNAGCP